MPLKNGASDKVREENTKTEIDAGKPVNQAVAIGYAKQRKAKGMKAKPKAKAKKKADPAPATAPYPSTPEDKERERKYRAEDGLRTLQRAEEVRGDPDLMRDVANHASEQAEVAARAHHMVKSGLISDKQAAKLK